MIIEWIINALVAIIKLPIALLHLPSLDVSSVFETLEPYIRMAGSWLWFFFDDIALMAMGITLTVIGLFKVVDIISTIVGFFKKTGD